MDFCNSGDVFCAENGVKAHKPPLALCSHSSQKGWVRSIPMGSRAHGMVFPAQLRCSCLTSVLCGVCVDLWSQESALIVTRVVLLPRSACPGYGQSGKLDNGRAEGKGFYFCLLVSMSQPWQGKESLFPIIPGGASLGKEELFLATYKI